MANLYEDPKLKATINLDLLNKKSGNQVQNDNLNNFQLSASNTPITPTTPITKDKQSGLGLTGSKTSAVITSDPITGADKKQEIDKVNEDIKKDEEIATLTRDAKIKALKDQLGLSGTSTTAPSLVEQYSKLREEQGVSNLETRLTDINAQIQAKRDEFNKFKRDSEGQGRGITTSIISGQQKKVADQLQTEMDSLAREGEILTNQLNTKNNFISTIMNLTGKDYEIAKAEQQQTFDNNYKIQTLYNAQASESQRLASTYLTSLTNLIQNSGVNWDTIDNTTRATIYQKELEAGWVPGTLESFAKVKPKANLLATVDNGNGTTSFIYADEKGEPGIVKTVNAGKNSSSGEYTTIQNKMVDQINTAVANSYTYKAVNSARGYTDGVLAALTLQTGAGDIAAINQYQKVIDEGAVTRDQDVKLIQDSQSFINSIKTKIKKLEKGEQLSGELRKQMKESVISLYQAKIRALEDDPFIQSQKIKANNNSININDTILGLLGTFDSQKSQSSSYKIGDVVTKNGKKYQKVEGGWIELTK